MSEYLPVKSSHTLLGTDMEIGPLAYGLWRFAGSALEDATRKVETALAAGMTLIDTADIYADVWPTGFGASERLLGEVVTAHPAIRHQMVLATKGGIVPGLPYNSSRDYIISACEGSLTRLKTDVIDLYQIHRPDLTAPFAETADALDRLVTDGKIRAVGVSNFTPSQVSALKAHLKAPIVSTQPEISCMTVDSVFDGTLDQCQQNGMIAFAWSPIAGGALITGKAEDSRAQGKLERVIGVLDRLAEENRTDRSAIALAFLLAHPAGIVPIIGTQTPARITASAEATGIKLTRRDWYDILEASLGEQMP
jgi:predicted oxidoreductase